MNNNLTTSLVPFSYGVELALAASSRGTVTLNMTADSMFELHSIFAAGSASAATEQTPNSFSCQMTDAATGRQFSNDLVPQSIFCGDVFNGIIQRRPLVFAPQSIISFDIQNLIADTNTVRIVLAGYKLLDLSTPVNQANGTENIIPFIYITSKALTALQTDEVTLNMHSDSHFELHSILGRCSKQAVTAVSPNLFRVGMTDVSTGRQLTNARLCQATIAGSSFNQFMQPRAVRFLQQTQIRYDLTDLSNDNNTVIMALAGYKVILGPPTA